MDTPTYCRGQQVALRFAATEADPGLYTLLRADLSPAQPATTWRPQGHYSMQLPRRLTIWAEIVGTTARGGGSITLATPAELARHTFSLPAAELTACIASTLHT